ncbi:NAD(P)H-hydrate dehydratase [Marinibaculum pumilum]|uniref:Bifunctional NAD(P)H-hydrate repair enzyme n=1 Tax=Marinibaculum pumilum TaxID=1766165 RepID=A0ABV7KUJ1_9PROT
MTGHGIAAAAWRDLALLSTAEMGEADRQAIAGGTPGFTLMQAAAAGIVRVTTEMFSPRPVTILCGPGNNGGDGYVAADMLRRRGWPVTVQALGDPARLAGDALTAWRRWDAPVAPLTDAPPAGTALVIDALFGAGLARDLEGPAAAALGGVAAAGLPSIAVDVPSGLDGNSGRIRGTCLPATATVTFFRLKPGHLLLPGRALCGRLALVDIGIPEGVLDAIAPGYARNHPALWQRVLPLPQAAGHKYSRGHLLVRAGGAAATGAARLAATAALHAGAGLVTLAADAAAIRTAACQLTAVMLAAAENAAAFDDLLQDERRNAVLLGPGNGVGADTRQAVLAALGRGRACVLDADALSSFRDDPDVLFGALHRACVLTPHDGEFKRLFPDLADPAAGPKTARVAAAAARSGAVVLLKGADTTIAAPDGPCLVNANAPPALATAGAGDVLAGIIGGLLAAGMPALAAAAAGTWLHGAAGTLAGAGASAEDLAAAVPAAWHQL